MEFPRVIFALDILYKWGMVYRNGTVLGAAALLLLHALLYKCCRSPAPTRLQAAVSILLAPLVILCQAFPCLRPPWLKPQEFPPYKFPNAGLFQVFIVGQATFWYCNWWYKGGQQNTFASPWLQLDALFSLLDGASHFYVLTETFNREVNVVILSCLLHDTCYSMFLNHSRHLIGWPSPLGILLVVSIGLRMVAVAGMGLILVFEAHSVFYACFVLFVFALFTAVVWPVSHTLGFFALLLCTINFFAAVNVDPKLLGVYRFLLRWITMGRRCSRLLYLRRRLGTSKLLQEGREGPSSLCAVWDTLAHSQGSWGGGVLCSLTLWAAAVSSGWLYISFIIYYHWEALSALLWISSTLVLLTASCVALGPYFSPVVSYAELSISSLYAEFSPPAHPLHPCTQQHRICEVMYRSPVLSVIQDYYHPRDALSALEYCVGRNFVVRDVRRAIAAFLEPGDLRLCLMQQMVVESNPQTPLD
eukprot:TRINITY_DN5362_c0_g1_i3.p1 TRINITY_DN5362_c0_g1~~TRINITY_DN5362_c0_g1_i3.p1  ORF type:complete len:474 (+),score=144.69 TRINITY_DN5362_c0_g1_i3:27-1448(+)